MKSLAFDQRTQIQRLCEPLGIASWFFDGDVDKEHRKILKANPPPILMTNPENLNMSFLGWKETVAEIPQEPAVCGHRRNARVSGILRWQICPLLLRRFLLHLNRIGASPRLFLSTATCENPVEHARNLTGRQVEVVSARRALRPRRHFVFVNPDIPDFKYRDILQRRVEQAALAVLNRGLQALVFCPTKKFLEDAYRKCQAKLRELNLDPGSISPFHSDLKPDDRQDIQKRIKDGAVKVVFTTNALELGLDIGGMDGVILVGFPASIMSAWQRIGRAGRSWNKDAFVLFYAMNDPIDGFFVGNLEAFLNKPFDALVVDPNNESLIEKHLGPLAYDVDGELRSSDQAILGHALYAAASKDMGKPAKGSYRPHASLSMRGNFGQSFALKSGTEELGQISTIRRFREAYIGAVFTFFGKKYRVHSHEVDAVVLTDVDPHLKTEAGFYTVLTTRDIFDGYGYGEFEIHYGSLNMVMNFTGYKLVDERSGEAIDAGGTERGALRKRSARILDQRSRARRDPYGDRRVGAFDTCRSYVCYPCRPIRCEYAFEGGQRAHRVVLRELFGWHWCCQEAVRGLADGSSEGHGGCRKLSVSFRMCELYRAGKVVQHQQYGDSQGTRIGVGERTVRAGGQGSGPDFS